MNDEIRENPELMAGVAMSMAARERAALEERAREGAEASGKGTMVTAFVVIAVLVATLALMLFMNNG